MKLLSVTNKRTQLHKCATDLSVVCTHENYHKRNVSSDISFFRSNVAINCFAQIYNTDVVEIWRLKSGKDNKESFDRIRKVKSDGIQAVACSKNKDSRPEYAIGYATGQVRVFELNSKNTRIVEFPGDPVNKVGVASLDYSNCGGYISSVYENGKINIFGLTTKIKFDSFKLEADTTLARFHPAKRFHLGIASFKGSVIVYDVSSKKVHFQQKDAHDAPCSDIAMAEETPDRLYTCGCDAMIKIFDTRKKSTGLQIESYCGLNTVSVTRCGGFFAVGNLKGDVLTYDLRNVGQILSKKNVDSEIITRVQFLPSWGETEEQMSKFSSMDSVASTISEDLPELPEPSDNYTMENMLKFQKGRISELDISSSSRVSFFRGESEHCGRVSDAFGQNIANALKDLSFSSETSLTEGAAAPQIDDANVNFERLKRFSGGRKDSNPKRRSSYLPSPLTLIQEEASDKENRSGALNSSELFGSPRFSSSPAVIHKEEEEKDAAKSPPQTNDIDASDSSFATPDEEKPATAIFVPPAPKPAEIPQLNVDLKNEFEALHEKIKFEFQSLNFDINGRHIEMMFTIVNQRRELQKRIDMIENCMGILMNDDFKIRRVLEVEQENKELRQQLNSLMTQMNFES